MTQRLVWDEIVLPKFDPSRAKSRMLYMMEHIQSQSYHARRGAIKNAFKYGIDYVLCDPTSITHPRLLSRNHFNLFSVWDHKHGGAINQGRGVAWFRDILEERDAPVADLRLLLLTQPSFLWTHFNPVSFWIALKDGQLVAFVAEVNNTFGDRHCYFCAHDDFRPIHKSDRISADKLMHVSPFQKVSGRYFFNFEFTDSKIDIRISYENGRDGVMATLSGPRRPATSASLLWAAIRRPFGALRVLTLIHWQALKLYVKKAPFLKKPPGPDVLISNNTSVEATSK
ncbi:MAG: DUF1365 domain-containing protein [Shimia sp.]|uniref:DUF1365 domain-containing protein n=1 Tax=Shimia sp. TaxID=1954381 RepID=UPI00405891DB